MKNILKKSLYRLLQIVLVLAIVTFSYFMLQIAITGHLTSYWPQMYHEIIYNRAATIINLIVLLIMVITIIAIVGDYWWGIATAISFLAIVIFVDYQKILSRSEPLLPSDLLMVGQVGDLIKMVKWFSIVELLLFLIALGLIAFGIRKLTRSFWLTNHRIIWPLRGGLVILGIWAIAFVFQCGNTDSAASKQLAHYNIYNDNPNPLNVYRGSGSIIGFAFNVNSNPMQRPAGYNEAAIKKIAQRYRQDLPQTTLDKKNQDVNVVYILNESLTSPQTTADQYPLQEDSPLSYIDNILEDPQNNQASGYMVSPEYGGGTANVEFEANTGFSNFFLKNIPYQDILPAKDSFPSIMNYLNNYNYESNAYHPYSGSMYQRPQTYRALGIKHFSDQKKLHGLRKTAFGNYYTDESTYPNIYKQQKKAKQLSLVITMQNHMPYNEAMGPQSSYQLSDAPNSNKSNKLQTYFQELHQSDQAFKHLVNHFQNSNHKTIIVMYGDHYPGDGLYDDLTNETLTVHATPFVMVANFPLKVHNYGYFSPNYMPWMLLQQLDYPLTPFYNLLSQLYQVVPVLTKSIQIDSQDQQFTNQMSKSASHKAWQEKQVFRDYRLIEYDMTYGKSYASKYKMFSVK